MAANQRHVTLCCLWACVVGALGVPSHAPAVCASNQTQNITITTIPHGELGLRDLSNVSACEQACCNTQNCTAWTFTPVPRPRCMSGCCFLKSAPSTTVDKHTDTDAGYTSGCLGFTCANPNPYPLPFDYTTPAFSVDRVIASMENTTLRDPTTAVFDPVTSTWHIYCTHVSGGRGQGGYPGVVWHWSLNSTDVFDKSVAWKSEGAVVNATHVPGTFDEGGVFTPGVVREDNKWILFYGGVEAHDRNHHESVGVAMADSPFGPFKRYENNPVFTRFDANMAWCNATSKPARVDEIKASVVLGRKFLLVKGVCQNFTALPLMYEPVDGTSWAPPYRPVTLEPLFSANDTCGKSGFEEPTLFRGPEDGFLHYLGHCHSYCEYGDYSHLISRDGSFSGFEQATPFYQYPAEEPVPIPASGDGVFGGKILSKWIDFPGTQLTLMNVTWVWTNRTK
eukprot:m.41422 g.41422  ORF g.41422 m.41422 type:complete len:451 (-) comp11456_c0_seq1:87-1439(-)